MSLALERTGTIDRLGARPRLLATLILLLGVTALQGLPAQALALGLALLLVLAGGQPLRPLGRRLLHLEGFLLALLLLLPLTVPGPALLDLGPVIISETGLLRALGVVLKVNAAILVIFALIGGLEPLRLGHAARGLGVPLRLVQLFLFTSRHIEVYRGEIRRLRDAMKARAFTARTSLHSFRSFGNLAGMVLVRALEKSARVEEAMRCRAFDGRLPAIAPEDEGAGGALCVTLAVLAALALLLLDHWP